MKPPDFAILQLFHIAMKRQHFEDFEKNAVSNFEEIEKNRIKDFEETGICAAAEVVDVGVPKCSM